MRKKLLISALVGCSFMFCGCATILTGTSQKINVKSPEKPGVKFSIEGKTYATPAVVEIKKGEDKIITILDEECVQRQVVVKKKFNPATLGNLISGGVVGLTTDYLSGAIWEYESDVTVSCK